MKQLNKANESRNTFTSVDKSLSSKTTEDFKCEFLNSIGGRWNRWGALAPNHLPSSYKVDWTENSKKIVSPEWTGA